MGFWLFMLGMTGLTAAVLIGGGRLMWKHCPAEINEAFGYRTRRSMMNQDTWRFANEYCGRLWWRIGWWSLILSTLVMLCLLHAGQDTISAAGVILMTVQMALMGIAIFLTEGALKKTFDKEGNRR